MADLPQGVSTYQSGTNDTATLLVNNVSPMNANQMNGAYDAIIQMQAILGAGPDLKGSVADLAARLAVQMSAAGILLPIGCMLMHGGVLPTGFIDAFGQEISRTGIYANLFAVYGTTFGAGNGTTTFNVIDMRSRVPIGLGTGTGGGASGTGLPSGGTSLSNVLMGAWTGKETHVLTSTEVPNHTHGITDPGHRHSESAGGTSGGATIYTVAKEILYDNPDNTALTNLTSVNATGISVNSTTGGGNAHTIINPQMGVRFIIKY